MAIRPFQVLLRLAPFLTLTIVPQLPPGRVKGECQGGICAQAREIARELIWNPSSKYPSFLKPCSHSTPGTHAADWKAHLLGIFGQPVLAVSVAPILGQHGVWGMAGLLHLQKSEPGYATMHGPPIGTGENSSTLWTTG